jgi:uncharacterized protein related to proFAR isomerase
MNRCSADLLDQMRKGKKIIYACPFCGSRDLEGRALVSGPMATVDRDPEMYRCRSCGQIAKPLMFEVPEEWSDFRKSKGGAEAAAEPIKGFSHIPILPVDTPSLLSFGETKVPVAQLARVVSVRWDGLRVVPTDYSQSFAKYWKAVGGQRYNAPEVMLMDLSGINEGKPNFRVLKELVKRKYNIWLDMGMSSEQDLFDAFAMEVSMAMAGTMNAPSIHLYETFYELSDRCVPTVQVAGSVVWGKPRAGPKEIKAVLNRLGMIGFDQVAVIDLDRLGTKEGVSKALTAQLEDVEQDLWIGGGVVETDLDFLKEAGFMGAFIDPFTPVIADLLEEEEKELPVDAHVTVAKPTRSSHSIPTD